MCISSWIKCCRSRKNPWYISPRLYSWNEEKWVHSISSITLDSRKTREKHKNTLKNKNSWNTGQEYWRERIFCFLNVVRVLDVSAASGSERIRCQLDTVLNQPTRGLSRSTHLVLQLHDASWKRIVNQLVKCISSGHSQGFPMARELPTIFSCIVGIIRRQYWFLLSGE